MLNEAIELVKEFMIRAEQPVSSKPVSLGKERVKIRASWLQEEINEFMNAKDVYDQTDSIMDLIYYAFGTLVELGIKPDELFMMLHEKNLLKANNLITDNCGKVLKPSDWKHPDNEIHAIIDKQLNSQ